MSQAQSATAAVDLRRRQDERGSVTGQFILEVREPDELVAQTRMGIVTIILHSFCLSFVVY